MAKRDGVEMDGLFRRGLAAPLDYAGPGWERGLGEGQRSSPRKGSAVRLPAEMPGVMRVLPSGLGKHRMLGRSIFGQAGGLGLGDEVHRLLERVEWGGLDPAWKEEVSPEAWKLAEEFCRSAAGREIFGKREGCRVWREKALEVLDGENRLVAAAVDRAVLEEKKNGELRIYDFKTDQVTEESEWLERHGPQLRTYAELLGGWWRKRGGGGVRVWIAAVRTGRLIEVPRQ
ncbi:MAG: hypothetical protein RLZZ112_361 [Verrucomicrobiota bacterium]